MAKTTAEFIRGVPLFSLDKYDAGVSDWTCHSDEAWPTPFDIGIPFLELCLAMSVLDMGYDSLERVWFKLWADAEMAYSGMIESAVDQIGFGSIDLTSHYANRQFTPSRIGVS